MTRQNTIIPSSLFREKRATWQQDDDAIDKGLPDRGPGRFVSVYFAHPTKPGTFVELYGTPDSLRQAAAELVALADQIERARP